MVRIWPELRRDRGREREGKRRNHEHQLVLEREPEVVGEGPLHASAYPDEADAPDLIDIERALRARLVLAGRSAVVDDLLARALVELVAHGDADARGHVGDASGDETERSEAVAEVVRHGTGQPVAVRESKLGVQRKVRRRLSRLPLQPLVRHVVRGRLATDRVAEPHATDQALPEHPVVACQDTHARETETPGDLVVDVLARRAKELGAAIGLVAEVVGGEALATFAASSRLQITPLAPRKTATISRGPTMKSPPRNHGLAPARRDFLLLWRRVTWRGTRRTTSTTAPRRHGRQLAASNLPRPGLASAGAP